MQVGFEGGEEGELAGDHDEEDHAQGPHVGRLTVILALARQIRAHVLRSAALLDQLLILVAGRREAEVDQLDLAHAVDEDVVELQVSVHDAVRVHVLYGAHDLGEDGGRFLLGETLVGLALLELVEEVGPAAELHHEVHVSPQVDHFMQPHDVGVLERGEDVDLPVEGLGRLLLHKILLLVGFESHDVTRLLVRRPLDNGEGARPDLKPNLEVVDVEHLAPHWLGHLPCSSVTLLIGLAAII
mmetsp:Transcript_11407/g.19247  ORF Transcript_11407/g.19247 Transcript_11407/m.19247 type:complete len:242 (+) Transcript_11407:423-1148(+)